MELAINIDYSKNNNEMISDQVLPLIGVISGKQRR